MPRTAKARYSGDGKLMGNYGWVQNTSNLSTVRDTVELVPEGGISHNALMRSIFAYRMARGEIRERWTWDARCRIKAVCASGMVEINRENQGYRLTPLGRKLCDAPKGYKYHRKKRLLTPEEIELFRKGLLTNPPVVRVLTLLNDSRKAGLGAMSKYDVGSGLGFVGDVGFTHYEAEFVVRNKKSFNDAEGDADKWARTIISWLKQVGWVVDDGHREISGRKLKLFTTVYEVDRVLRYAAHSAVKYIPQEMLCSGHHPFAEIIQQRRVAILKMLSKNPHMPISEMVEDMRAAGIDTDEETLAFDILNLRQAGVQISRERSYYRLTDKIRLDAAADKPVSARKKVDGVEKLIEHYVALYAESLPSRLVDNIIRYGYGGAASAGLFEMTVNKLFSHMGFETTHLGQGRGRVADGIAKYRDSLYAKSYALILDAKAYEKYSLPAGDIRKMKEYIALHGGELLEDKIPRHAFAFVSVDFTCPEDKLAEIADDTAVSGTAIDVFSLLELGSKFSQRLVSILDLYPCFTTNRQFICP